MTYYDEQKKAFVSLHRILKNAKRSDTEINVKKLLIEMTQSFAVGRKPILDRINDMAKLYGEYDIIDDVIVWRKTK